MKRHEPKWLEIYEKLKSDVESGTLTVGRDYPTESELIDRFNVSRTTIRRVLSELFRAGYVNIRPGKCREIARPEPVRYAKVPLNDPSSETSFGRHLKSIARSLRLSGEDQPYDKIIVAPRRGLWHCTSTEPRLPPEEIKQCFGLGNNDQIIWLMRARGARRNPLVLQWVVVPVSLVPRIRQDSLGPGGLTAVYEAAGITRNSYASVFQPTMASGTEARHLQVENGTPLIEERRISRCKKGNGLVAYELLVTLYSNRIRLEFDWFVAENDTLEVEKSSKPAKRSASCSQSTTKRSKPKL